MKVLVDDQLSSKLREIQEPVEIRDGQGRTSGYFHPTAAVRGGGRQRPLRSPFGDEELARRQQVPGGRPLAEIWKDLADK
ncbi:MAG: hypothetical protein KKE86_06510 [Planctomycetes bacterium]|nr:hypothetical protein [Planctomycetota bacterium]MBU4398974.1 hypothetical protein [Planctomycetota bacterium]MCG2685186.1 hypothetical protein [Planctomycetales bacterium]